MPDAPIADSSNSALEADLLVVGGGMAGLTAGAYASRAGATVVVVDSAAEIGGSARISGGYLWTAPDLASLQGEDPDVDARLGAVLTGRFLEAIHWVRSTGVTLSDRITGIYGFGHGFQTDITDYLARCRSIIEANGGWVVTGVEVHGLTAADRSVLGAVASDRDQGQVSLRAEATLLATGGFQGDPAMRERLIGPGAGRMALRSNPDSSGGGVRLGLAAGASFTDGVTGFYGHLLPRPLAELREQDFIPLAQLHSGYSLLLDIGGRRFTDESLGDHVNNQMVFHQPEQRALLVADEHVRREHVIAPYIPGMEGVDKFALAAEAGANVVRANTLEELAETAGGWGFGARQILGTISRYNREVADGLGPGVPPSSRYGRALDTPPYFAVEVQPGITFTYGGLCTDQRARVLGEEGPIGGLLAAGADAGGLYKRGYAGGLARGLVFGMVAAQTATAATGVEGT